MTPLRVTDTRPASGMANSGRTLVTGATQNVLVAGRGVVPAMTSAAPPKALVVNVTATDRSYPRAARRSWRFDRTASVSATVTTVDSGPSTKSISMSIRPPTFAARTNDSWKP